MAIELRVPPVGESVKEAVIATWFKKPGDSVARDEKLVELETDKVNVEVNAPQAGVLVEILRAAGEQVQVDELIGRMEARDEAATSPAAPAPSAPAAPPPAAPAQGRGKAADVVSPAAMRLAKESGVDPSALQGTGRDGRVMKEDVMAALEKSAAAPAPTPAAPPPAAPVAPSAGREERIRMSPLRRRLAQRLVTVQQTAAILTTFNEVDMSAIMAMRQRYQERFVKRYNVKLGFMSFFTKAAIEALKEFPGLNAEIDGDDIIYKYHYDVGVAVGGGKGLVVPVVRDADRLSFAELEQKIAEYGKRARDNKLTVDELTGGTFTISNGGVYGSMMSTPILNPPQTGILGMHNIIERPVAVDGKVEIRPMMYLALSYDHRVVDGREAVSFLVRIKECIENPERILLEV